MFMCRRSVRSHVSYNEHTLKTETSTSNNWEEINVFVNCFKGVLTFQTVNRSGLCCFWAESGHTGSITRITLMSKIKSIDPKCPQHGWHVSPISPSDLSVLSPPGPFCCGSRRRWRNHHFLRILSTRRYGEWLWKSILWWKDEEFGAAVGNLTCE